MQHPLLLTRDAQSSGLGQNTASPLSQSVSGREPNGHTHRGELMRATHSLPLFTSPSLVTSPLSRVQKIFLIYFSTPATHNSRPSGLLPALTGNDLLPGT